MKLSNLHKTVLTGAIALGVAAVPMILPASATDTTGTGTGINDPATTTTDPNVTSPDYTTSGDFEEDDGFDWGWLGLIGLAGLAGLAKKPEERVQYRETTTPADPATGSSSRSDYYR